MDYRLSVVKGSPHQSKIGTLTEIPAIYSARASGVSYTWFDSVSRDQLPPDQLP